MNGSRDTDAIHIRDGLRTFSPSEKLGSVVECPPVRSLEMTTLSPSERLGSDVECLLQTLSPSEKFGVMQNVFLIERYY